MKHTILVLTVSVLLVALLAGIGGAAHDLFREMDADKNERVSHEEFATDMEKEAFNKLDSDRNGVLTSEEWNLGDYITENNRKEEVFRHVDSDANKRISYPEFRDFAKKYSNLEEAFMTLDKNRDGSLAPDEVTVRPLFRLIKIRY